MVVLMVWVGGPMGGLAAVGQEPKGIPTPPMLSRIATGKETEFLWFGPDAFALPQIKTPGSAKHKHKIWC